MLGCYWYFGRVGASTVFDDVSILNVLSTGIVKLSRISGDRRKFASFIVTKTSAPLEIRNLVKRLISRVR